jgi:hypothetical protein
VQSRRTAEVSFGKQAHDAIILWTSVGADFGTCLKIKKFHSSSVKWILGLKSPSNNYTTSSVGHH